MSRPRRFNTAVTRLAVGLTSLIAALALGEASLRLVSARWLRSYDVEMWRYARFVKFISDDPEVVEEHRPNASERLMGVRVRTDANGFRLPDPETEGQRRSGDRKVVALGDSLTFGWGVPEGQTFPDQLQRQAESACATRGRGTSVYNAGIGNCNTAMELARYETRIRPRLRPDWLILGFSINDAEPTPAPEQNPLFWKSALFALSYARFVRRWDPALRDYADYYAGLFEDGRPGWERAKQALRELGAVLRAEAIPGTILLMPELHNPHDPRLAAAFSKVAVVAQESGLEVVDATPEFPEGSGRRYWVSAEDAHPDAAAQALYVRALGRSSHACSQ